MQVVHGMSKQRHKRRRPGFICCRAYDTDKQRVLPLPLSSVKVNHKLVDEVKSAPSSMHEVWQQSALADLLTQFKCITERHRRDRKEATVQTARMTKLSKERLQVLEGRVMRKRRTGSRSQKLAWLIYI